MILSLETSGLTCSAALHENGQLRAGIHIQEEQSTASLLSVAIDQVCNLAGIKPRNLKAVAVSSGPGSYTGLRIGVATAKGICFGLNIPLISINSLDLLAHQAQASNTSGAWLCPMFDARRMEVYTRLYDEQLNPLNEVSARIIDENSFQQELSRHAIAFFGSGAEKCKTLLNHPNASFFPDLMPDAHYMGEQANAKWIRNEFEDTASFEPFYLKDFMVKSAVVK